MPVTSLISFEGKKVYLSANTSALATCEDSQIALGQLSLFLSQNRLRVRPAHPDQEQAYAFNITHANCTSTSGGTTLIVQAGTSARISSPLPGCYLLEVANCSIIPVVEKFITESLVEARLSS